MKRLIAIIASLGLMVPTIYAADFSDVAENYQYSDGIDYLFENDVVSGYPDGTFKPLGKINRAELTKIAVESVGLDLVDASECFPDIDVNEWYATYVCTAKEAGWIEGYPDGTFQPARTINRAESLKIIAEAEGWDVSEDFDEAFQDTPSDQWFSKYVAHAAALNFLPFEGEFDPANEIRRGEFSEVYYRVLYTRNEGLDEFIEPDSDVEDTNTEEDTEDEVVEEPDAEEIEISDTIEVDLGASGYSSNVFDNIILDSEFPKTFFKDEVYRFEGEIVNGSYDSMFVFSYLESDPSNVSTFSSDVDGGRFSVNMYFDTKGDYILGIIPGRSGSSKIARITVGDLPITRLSIDPPDEPTPLEIAFDGDKSRARYSTDASISRVTFEQFGDTVTYLSRQSGNSIDLRYADFEDFEAGSVTWKIEVANTNPSLPFDRISDWSDPRTQTFNAVNHYFSEVESTVDLDSLPDFHTTGQTITLSGSTSTDLSSNFYAILPDGQVYTSKVDDTYNAGDNFSYSYTFETSGTHILEINDTKGLAVVNHPVYQQNTVPLIPDYFDLNTLQLDTSSSFDAASESAEMLQYVNSARSAHGVDPVVSDSSLYSLALAHSSDMKSKGYFAHVNLSGDSPNDRRVDAGIETIVGENIAKSVDSRFAHEALMRSAVHRANILNPMWTKVGIGVARNSEGYFYVTQEFSFDLSALKDDFKDSFDDERSSDLEVNSVLETATEDWLDKMVDEGFFATENDGEKIFDYLGDGHGLTELKALILSGGDVSAMTDLGIENSDIELSKWTDVGYAISITDEGSIYLVVLYGK